MITSKRIPIISRSQGYFFRWYYSGWHYWQFYPGGLTYKTEGEKYRTYGTRSINVSSGPLTETQVEAVRTILNTREVYLYSDAGWMAVRIETGTAGIKNNITKGCEVELTAIIGSRMLSVTGYSPVVDIPVIPPTETQCEITIGLQVWMCKNYDSNYPGSKVYNDDEANRALYGGLYTFDMIRNPGFCPDGWRVSTESDWLALANIAGGSEGLGAKLKEIGLTYWNSPNSGAVDSFGFKARGAGYYGPLVGGGVGYGGLKTVSNLWVDKPGSTGRVTQMINDGEDLNTNTLPSGIYASVRLIKNNEAIFTDIDGNIYTTVVIGGLRWMVENLKTTKYKDGTPIPNLTEAGFTDYFLPANNLLVEIYNNIHLYGLGNFDPISYWSSSEFDASNARYVDFTNGYELAGLKSSSARIRPCRSFMAGVGEYSLRDTGPSGGLICYVDGTTYYEVALNDISSSAWSNIDSVAIGTTSLLISQSQSNTLKVILQSGHTSSAAKLCNDLVAGIGWVSDTEGAYCWMANDIINKDIYGGLYNWYAVNNVHGLAPEGWRMPTDEDWTALINEIGGTSEGGALKQEGYASWSYPNTGATNVTLFNAIGAGNRSPSFAYLLEKGTFWSATPQLYNSANVVELNYNRSDIIQYTPIRSIGFSVRCVRDVI